MDYKNVIKKINDELSVSQRDTNTLVRSFTKLAGSVQNPNELALNTFEVLKSAELVAMDTYDDEDFVFNAIKFYDELKTEMCLSTDNDFFKTLVDLMFTVEEEVEGE